MDQPAKFAAWVDMYPQLGAFAVARLGREREAMDEQQCLERALIGAADIAQRAGVTVVQVAGGCPGQAGDARAAVACGAEQTASRGIGDQVIVRVGAAILDLEAGVLRVQCARGGSRARAG